MDIASSNQLTRGSGATATATVNASGAVTAINITNGGSNYTAPVLVNIFGTEDTFEIAKGARANAVITNGVITAMNLTNGGANYISGKTSISINPANKAVVLPRVDLVAVTNNTSKYS